MRRSTLVAMLALICSLLALSVRSRAAQPAQPGVCKGQGKVGKPSDAPDGWAVYCNARGVTWTPLNRYEPKVIPNTENDYVWQLEISDDGQWIMYMSRNGNREPVLVMVKRDGTGYTQLKPDRLGESNQPDPGAGFWHQSPNVKGPAKAEIWYSASQKELLAAEVDFSSGKPVIVGKPRTFVKLDPDGRQGMVASRDDEWAIKVSANHILTGYWQGTIPDGGKGIVTNENARVSTHGCGNTLSFDGTLTASNAGAHRENPPWVPVGHQGVMVVKFNDESLPAYAKIRPYIENETVSVNLAPTATEVWHTYEFTNDPNYLVLTHYRKVGAWAVGEAEEPNQGIWVVHWPSNVWFHVAHEPGTRLTAPFAYIEPKQVAAGSRRSGAEPAATKPAPATTRPIEKDPSVRLVMTGNLDRRVLARALASGPLIDADALGRRGLVTWSPAGAFRFQGGCVTDGEGAVSRGFLAEARKSDAMTIQCSLTPDHPTAEGVLAGLLNADGTGPMNISWEAKGLRLTVGEGAGALVLPVPLAPGHPVHLTISYARGELVAYVDGRQAGRTKGQPGLLGDRPNARLFFGSGPGGSKAWHGLMEDLVLLTRAVDATEAGKTFAAIKAARKARPHVPRLKVLARLTSPPEFSRPENIPYLVGFGMLTYDVEKVLEGRAPADNTIGVAHWVWVDRTPLDIYQRKVGQTYELELEPLDSHPEMLKEQVTGDQAPFIELPPERQFFDVGHIRVLGGAKRVEDDLTVREQL